ncbi:hypothetical protein CD006_21180 [Enterobacter sp. 10-1]|nr:hypothetical protein CD006_21180 [Enterobacter sp. 10-1]
MFLQGLLCGALTLTFASAEEDERVDRPKGAAAGRPAIPVIRLTSWRGRPNKPILTQNKVSRLSLLFTEA